ncbi:hypothetical protein [Stenoxybacter acetivorans]|uniref:hypothetical protein n=1 Tax=Stenoxybacter acetivorans TaxID=422441 RepID=UPI00056648C8|nr:hypothetical protein [Stenoxybacter acetivorans]
MNKKLRSHTQISQDVAAVLQQRQWSLRACVAHFNQEFYNDIQLHKVKRLNKDCVARVVSGKFKVLSDRAITLCEFLGVAVYEQNDLSHNLQTEWDMVRCAANRNPQAIPQIRQLLRGISELAQPKTPYQRKG